MATGIVSVALWLAGHESLSGVLLALAIVLWVALAGVVITRRSFSYEPAVLTAVAGTCVLGTRFALGEHTGWATVTLVLGAVLLAVLTGPVLRHLARRTVGAALLLTVATESVAGLAATLSGSPWLRVPAGVLLIAGLILYGIVLRRFDFTEVGRGCGDQWILGGALAISALAATKLDLESPAIVLWALDIAWVPVLLAAEARRPRLAYDGRRWATVFPVGMDATATLALADQLKSSALMAVGRVWTWVALLLWFLVGLGFLRRMVTGARTHPQPFRR